MTTFYEFLSDQALRDRLPFTIDFDIRPVDTEDTTPTKTIGKLTFPVLDSLLPREIWFFDAIDEASGSNAAQARLEQILVSMAKELSAACSVESLVDALRYVYNTPEDIQEHENFDKYLNATSSLRSELVTVSKNLSNDSYTWLKVTFFIMSRIDSNWDVSKTSALMPKVLTEIVDLIESENNGTTTNPPVDEEFTNNDASLPEGK